MLRLLKVFLLAFFIVAALSPAGAIEAVNNQIDNLHIEALTQSVDISPCETAAFEFRLTNIGSLTDTFYLGVDPFVGNAKLTKNTLILKPSVSQVVKLYITPACDLYGNFEVSLLAQSKSSEALFSETAVLDIMPNDVLLIAPYVNKIKAGYEPSFVELPLANIGPRESAYILALETAVDWIKLKPESVTIAANSSQSAKLFMLPPSTADNGVYEATVVAKTGSGREYAKTFRIMLKSPGINSYIEAKVSSILHFFASYWWKILLAVALMIFGAPLLVLFFIWRSATREIRKELKEQRQKEKEEQKQEKIRDNLKLQKQMESKKQEAETINYSNLAKKAVPVLKRELNKEFKLIPKNPDFNILKLVGLSLLVMAVLAAAYLVYAFYDALFYFKLYAAAALASLILCMVIFFAVRAVKSRHIKEALSPADAVRIKSEIKEQLFDDYNIVHKSTFRKFSSLRWIFWLVVALFLIGLSALSLFVLSSISALPIFNLVGFALLALAVVCIIFATVQHCLYLKNTARFFFGKLSKKQLAVSLEWLGGLYKLAFLPSSKTEHAALLVRKFRKFAEKPGDRAYQYFEIESHNLTVKELKLFFSIRKSWLGDGKAKLMQFTDKWISLPTTKVSEDEKFFYYEACANNLNAVFAIACFCKPASITQETELQSRQISIAEESIPAGKRKLHYFLFAVSLLVVAVVISAAFYSSQLQPADKSNIDGITKIEDVTNHVAGLPSNITAGIPLQQWMENTEQRIDLSKYFNDPDNEALVFSASPVEHVSIRFERATAVLVPDFNWNGNTAVIFRATDSDGATASSNLVELVVTPAPEKLKIQQFFASFKPYIKYFLLGVVMVIAVMALFELKRD